MAGVRKRVDGQRTRHRCRPCPGSHPIGSATPINGIAHCESSPACRISPLVRFLLNLQMAVLLRLLRLRYLLFGTAVGGGLAAHKVRPSRSIATEMLIDFHSRNTKI